MAGEDSAAAEPRPGESSQDQEKGQVVSETERQGTERVAPQEMPQERATKPTPPLPQERENKPSPPLPQERETKPSPALPPRPLPATHTDTLKQQPLPPVPQGVHFGPLPIEETHETGDFVRPFSPGWQKTSFVLGALSLISSAVILGMGVALGFLNAPYYQTDSSSPVDIELGASGSAAGLAILVIMAENLKIVFSSRRQGMHPGALVAYHLIIWLLAVVGVIVTAMFNSTSAMSWYDYPSYQEGYMNAEVAVYEQVLLAFDCILLLTHFFLFVGSCVMTNRYNNAKRKVVIVTVPGPAGGYPGGQHPAYGSHQPFMSHPGAQSGQYPVPLIAQIPPGPGGGSGPTPASQAVLYGGYYAPAPQSMAWTTSQQPGNPGEWQGYYAPNPVSGRTSNNPARYSQRAPSAPALASSSGSRRSQRQSQAQAERQPQTPVQTTAPQEQPRTEEPVSEKTA